MKLTFNSIALAVSLTGLSLISAMEQPPVAPQIAAAAQQLAAVTEQQSTQLQQLAALKKYINLRRLFLGVGAALPDEVLGAGNPSEEFDAQVVKKIIQAFIEALYLGKIPLIVRQNGTITEIKGTIETYFDVAALKNLLIRINNEYFDDEDGAEIRALSEVIEKMKKENKPEELIKRANAELCTKQTTLAHGRAARYLKILKRCTKIAELTKELGNSEYVDITQSFDNAISYFEGRESAVEKCFALEKIFAALGLKLDVFCKVANIHYLANELINKKTVSKKILLKCLNIHSMLEWLGVIDNNVPSLDKVLTGALSFAVDCYKQRDKATLAVVSFLENYDSDEKQASEASRLPAPSAVALEVPRAEGSRIELIEKK